MRYQRLLDSLDSSASLLFLEAIYGSGTRTLLKQWEERGRRRPGEIRLRFNASRLPREPAAFLRVICAALRHRLEPELPELPADDGQLVQIVVAHLQKNRRPVAIAIYGADHLSDTAYGIVQNLLHAGVRLIIAGYDVAAQIAAAERRGLYFSVLGERDLWLTLGETRCLVEELGKALDHEALMALHEATEGHPGMIIASLESMPVECAAGVLSRDRALAAFLAEEPLHAWPSDFAGFLAQMVHLPRFTLTQAEVFTSSDNAARHLSRLSALSLGRMVWHPGIQERVFRWNERIRLVIRQAMPPPRIERAVLLERAAEAARAAGDDELLIAALVRGGQLDEAEELLRDRIWDVLPNAMSPLWVSLEQISPLDLVEQPGLLTARLRLSPHRSGSPVSARAAHRAGRLMVDAAQAGEPWRRVGDLAYAIEFALYAGERDRVIALFSRARDLIADLVASEAADAASGREVSELLLLAETIFRSGNTIPAAEIGRFAAQLIEADPGRLDPRGERLAFARRLILHDHRARGLEDAIDPDGLLAGLQFLWRDGDLVVASMTLMWGDLDDGEFAAADAHLRAAADRVADPEAWPILMLMRAHIAVYRKSPGELEAAISAYERGTLSEPGHFAQQSLSQMERITAYLGKKVGRTLPSPGYLPATPDGDRVFYPRTAFVVHLMEALYALRADNPAAVRVALGEAIALSPRRELGLYTLANASREEVEGLRDIAESMPGGERLRIEKALLFAGALHKPAIDLSEREREVLEHLRDGATNPEMAQSMFVSVNTVKFHRANLMRKLGAKTRDELLRTAATHGV